MPITRREQELWSPVEQSKFSDLSSLWMGISKILSQRKQELDHCRVINFLKLWVYSPFTFRLWKFCFLEFSCEMWGKIFFFQKMIFMNSENGNLDSCSAVNFSVPLSLNRHLSLFYFHLNWRITHLYL